MKIYNERGTYRGDVNIIVRYIAHPDALVEPCDVNGIGCGKRFKPGDIDCIIKIWGLEGLMSSQNGYTAPDGSWWASEKAYLQFRGEWKEPEDKRGVCIKCGKDLDTEFSYRVTPEGNMCYECWKPEE